MNLPTFTTEATDKLCKDIAKKSGGVCFLGFSRGKDSLCAWLNLRKYFKRIIPFHCASWPNMQFIDETLNYYEYEFQTRILRLMGPEFICSLSRGFYQPLDEYPALMQMDVKDYSKLDILTYLRRKYGLPKAWCAFGIMASESIDRMIYCKKNQGMNLRNKTFYPCWDWKRENLMDTLRESGLKLSCEYRYTDRTMGNPPSTTVNTIMREHFMADYRLILDCYPWAEARTVRSMKLNNAWLAKKEEELKARGGLAEGSHLRKEDIEETDADAEGYEGRWEEDTEGGEE